MTFSGILQYFCEICLYISTLGGVVRVFGEIEHSRFYVAAFALIGVVFCLCSKAKGILKYLPSILFVPLFLRVGNVAQALVLLPLCALVVVKNAKGLWLADYEQSKETIRFGLGIFCGALLFAVVTSSYQVFVEEALPYFVLWLSLSILCLRILRSENNHPGSLGPGVYAMNAGLVALVAAGSFLVSSRKSLAVMKAILSFIYNKIIARLLMLLAYSLMFIPYFLGKLIENLKLEEPQPMQNVLEMNITDMFDEAEIELPEDEETSKFIFYLIMAIGILVFLLVTFLVIRKLLGRSSATRLAPTRVERERLDAEQPEEKKHLRLRRRPADVVRLCYRKYLDLADSESIPTDGTIASDVIQYRTEGRMGSEPTEKLRSLWLPARYSETPSSESDAEEAKACLKKIRENMR